MYCVYLIIGVGMLCLGACGIYVSLRRQNAGEGWWAVWVILLTLGAVAGAVQSFVFIPVSAGLRLSGLPVPIAVFRLESGQWVDYVSGGIGLIAGVTINALVWSLAFVLPLSLRFGFFRPWKKYPAGTCQGCGYDLTGNMSGRCPECGREVPRAALRENDSHRSN
jgi:hypothetical protein